MKKQTLLKSALLTLVGVGLLATHASAATTTYAPGNLFIGFYDSTRNSTQSFLVNAGPAANFRDAAVGSTISIGSFDASLTTTFGEDWSFNQDIRWFVFGAVFNEAVGSDPAWTLYAGADRNDVDVVSPAYEVGATSAQASTGNKIDDVGVAFSGKTSPTSNTLIQTNTATNSLFNATDGIVIFDSYTTGGFGDGTEGTVLDLYRMRGDLETRDGSLGTLEGKFTIDDAGSIIFTAAVPEPSTLALLFGASGITGLALLRRKRCSR